MNDQRYPRARCPVFLSLMFITVGLGGLGCSGSTGGSRNTVDTDGDGIPDQPDDGTGTGGGAGLPSVEPAFVGMHRLNNVEYDNTIRDLLGVTATPASTFVGGEEALGFDNIATALGMTPAQMEQYFDAAEAVTAAAFSDAQLRARILTCSPSGNDTSPCLREIIGGFGLRAFRRPLRADEIDRLVALAGAARAVGEDFPGSVKHVVAAMLASPNFLYRIELDPDPSATKVRPLDGYELASRLSYFLSSTMPDPALLAAAGDGSLLTSKGLEQELGRLLDDGQAPGLVDGFAAQWLSLRSLEDHQVDPRVYPEWDEPLRRSMIDEGKRFFQLFLAGERNVNEFFTTPVNFVDARLASHYGLSPPAAGATERVDDADPARLGFLGTAAFLTSTSFTYRTSPTSRGVTVYRGLLCGAVPDPPGDIPELDEGGGSDAAAIQNVRDRLAEHRSNAGCASCHSLFDPVGLGLENFDAVGRFRTEYANGETIDASGELPDGTTFSGLAELAPILAADPGFPDCLMRNLFVYAHGRAIDAGDDGALAHLGAAFVKQEFSMPSLVRSLVHDQSFRSRKPEGTIGEEQQP